MSKELFAQRLKASMEKQHMKQIDLVRAAETCGIKLGKSHVSQYVSGKTLPRADVLHFLADALHTDPDWLSGMNGPETAAGEEKICVHLRNHQSLTMFYMM